MRSLLIATIVFAWAVTSFGQSMQEYTDQANGFSVVYPPDWTVKKGTAERTKFKAVKRSADGTYLMLVVNIQTLNRDDYTTDDLSLSNLCVLASQDSANGVKLLSYTRNKANGIPCLRAQTEFNMPFVKPRIEHSTIVILRENLYTCTVSCNQPVYAKHKALLSKINSSFKVFAARGHMRSAQTTTPKAAIRSKSALESQETHATAFVKVLESRWLKYFGLSVAFLAISALWAKLQGRKSDQDEDNSE